MTTFAESMKRLRGGEALRPFAKRVGTSYGTIRRIENGENSSTELFEAIAERLGLHLRVEFVQEGGEPLEDRPLPVEAQTAIAAIIELAELGDDIAPLAEMLKAMAETARARAEAERTKAETMRKLGEMMKG